MASAASDAADSAPKHFAQGTGAYLGVLGNVPGRDASWLAGADAGLYALLESLYGPPAGALSRARLAAPAPSDA